MATKDKELKELRALTEMQLNQNKVEGYAVVYNSISEEMHFGNYGAFREIIRPGSATEALTKRDIPALYAHNREKILGRTSKGTLRLSEDQRGVHYSIDLPKTALGTDIREMVTRGDIIGASFWLDVPKGGDKWHTTKEGRLREISKMDIREITLTAFPAYPETSAALRSFEDWLEEEKRNASVPLEVRMQQVAMAEME